MGRRYLFAAGVVVALGVGLWTWRARHAGSEATVEDRQALLVRAQRAFERGADDEAIGAWREALRTGDDAQVRANLGSALLRAGRKEEARAELERALAARPGDARAWCDWGEVLRVRFGDGRAAEAAFRRAVELAPGMAEAHLGLGRVLGAFGDHEGALAEIEAALGLAAPNVAWRADAERDVAVEHMRKVEKEREKR